MSAEERRIRLRHGLKATAAEEVAINISYVIQAVGEEKAEKLVKKLAEMRGLVNSEMTRESKLVRSGIGTFNREEVLKAIEEEIQKDEAKATSEASEEPPQEEAVVAPSEPETTEEVETSASPDETTEE